jgi:heme/copper-type cytochrome/quinol oxidase subunit 2
MKVTRFQTDARLWEWIALAVLAASWCIPVISIKSGPYFSIATAFKELVAALHQHDDSATQLFRGVFIVFGSTSVVVAIVLGWLLHCLVVMVRARKRGRTRHAP